MANEGSTKPTYEELERAIISTLYVEVCNEDAETTYLLPAEPEPIVCDSLAEVVKEFYELSNREMLKLEAAEAENLRVRGLLQRQWISVEERLPELQEPVLLANDGEFELGLRGLDGQEWFWCDADGLISEKFYEFGTEGSTVTHWMPLPTFPQSSSLVPQGAESADIGKLDSADKSAARYCGDYHLAMDANGFCSNCGETEGAGSAETGGEKAAPHLDLESETPAGLPLTVGVEGDQLVIRMGVDTLAFCFEISESNQPFDEEANDYRREWKVTDRHKFAKGVCYGLMNEREDGSTPLSDVIDKAYTEAIESDMGVDEDGRIVTNEMLHPSPNFRRSPQNQPARRGVEGAHEGTTADKSGSAGFDELMEWALELFALLRFPDIGLRNATWDVIKRVAQRAALVRELDETPCTGCPMCADADEIAIADKSEPDKLNNAQKAYDSICGNGHNEECRLHNVALAESSLSSPPHDKDAK